MKRESLLSNLYLLKFLINEHALSLSNPILQSNSEMI